MTLSLFLDIVVAVLLLATIVYAALLNRKLAGLRSNRAELEELIRSFSDACARAETGVRTLRTATDEATRLQQYLERSQTLRDDLSYLLDRGTSLADRLEGGVRVARNEAQTRPSAPAMAPEPARPQPGRTAERAAERVAERALEFAERLERGERTERPERAERPVRERPSLRAAVGAELAGEVPTPRSKAERELLQALRSKR